MDAHTLGQWGHWKVADVGADAEAFQRCLAAVIFSWWHSSKFLKAMLIDAHQPALLNVNNMHRCGEGILISYVLCHSVK